MRSQARYGLVVVAMVLLGGGLYIWWHGSCEPAGAPQGTAPDAAAVMGLITTGQSAVNVSPTSRPYATTPTGNRGTNDGTLVASHRPDAGDTNGTAGTQTNLAVRSNGDIKLPTVRTTQPRAPADDTPTVEMLLADVQNGDQERRDLALEQIKQLEPGMAVPGLKALAEKTEDLQAKIAILQAIQFIELPSYVPNNKGTTASSQRPPRHVTKRPPPPSGIPSTPPVTEKPPAQGE